MRNNTVTKDLTTTQVCRYTTLVSDLEVTIEKKMISVTTHFKKLTTGIVYCLSYYLK